MSLFNRIAGKGGGGRRRLLRMLLERMHADGRLQREVEAIVQDEGNDFNLTAGAREEFEAKPVGFLMRQERLQVKSESAHRSKSASNQPSATLGEEASELVQELRQALTERMEADDDIQPLIAENNYRALRQPVQSLFHSLLVERNIVIDRPERQRLFDHVVGYVIGFGPLETLLADEHITEIRVLGWDRIWIVHNGMLKRANIRFDDAQHVLQIIDRIMVSNGRTLDVANPIMHFRVPDGSHISAAIPPASAVGAVLTIKKYTASYLNVQDLIQFGTISPKAMDFLRACVISQANILITGEQLSGMTTLLFLLSDFIPHDEFIIAVDDHFDMGGLKQEQIVHLQTRSTATYGLGESNKSQVVQEAIYMNPERLVIGDMDDESFGVLLHSVVPWMATRQAHSVADALSKLETVTQLSRGDDPTIPMRIGGRVDVVVHMERLLSGARRVGRISEVQYQDGQVVANDIFAMDVINQRLESILRFVNRPTEALLEQFKIYGRMSEVAINELFDDNPAE